MLDTPTSGRAPLEAARIRPPSEGLGGRLAGPPRVGMIRNLLSRDCKIRFGKQVRKTGSENRFGKGRAGRAGPGRARPGIDKQLHNIIYMQFYDRGSLRPRVLEAHVPSVPKSHRSQGPIGPPKVSHPKVSHPRDPWEPIYEIIQWQLNNSVAAE